MTNDKNTPEFWKTIKPGDVISLSDERTIKDKMAVGKGVGPEEIIISSIASIGIVPKGGGHKFADYIILSLDNDKSIFVKIVGSTVGLVIYDDAPDWEPATRKTLLEQDCTFLFCQPDGNEEWEANDLLYIDAINHDSSRVRYTMKPQGEIGGIVSYSQQDGIGLHQATIAEYVAEDINAADQELAVLEIGKPEFGLIKLLLGRPLAIGDVEVFNRK